MSVDRIIFMCESCLTASDRDRHCCGQPMIRCDAGEPGSDRSRPLYDREGRLRTHAPQWWLERHRGSKSINR